MATKPHNRLDGPRKCFLALVCVVIAVAFYSCDTAGSNPGQFYTIDDAKWAYGNTLTFNEHGDTLPGTVTAAAISVRHTNEYPYANLWVELSYQSADSVVSDTFNITFADEYGRWFGSGSGPVITLTDTLRPRLTPDPASKFALRHIMRVDVLTDIEQIGLALVTDTMFHNR